MIIAISGEDSWGRFDAFSSTLSICACQLLAILPEDIAQYPVVGLRFEYLNSFPFPLAVPSQRSLGLKLLSRLVFPLSSASTILEGISIHPNALQALNLLLPATIV